MRGPWLIVILLGIMAIGFAIGKLTNKPVVNEIVLPDISRQRDQIDAKNKRIAADSLLIKSLYLSIDSLSLKKVINHKKLNNDINKLKGFTPYIRNKYIDSIYGAGY